MAEPRLRDTPPLTIDPGRRSGDICLNGTRIPAEAVVYPVWSGDTAAFTAEGYGTTRAEVLLACWWWVSHGHMRREVRGETKRQALWTAWADHAHRVLGGWDKRTRKLCDPDDYVVPES